MKFCQPIKFQEVLRNIKENLDEGVSYCIYSKISDCSELDLDTICYIDDYPEITDDDDEIYSEFVVNNSLNIIFREELVQDVVRNVLHQKALATDGELIKAISYYSKNDSFMNFI